MPKKIIRILVIFSDDSFDTIKCRETTLLKAVAEALAMVKVVESKPKEIAVLEEFGLTGRLRYHLCVGCGRRIGRRRGKTDIAYCGRCRRQRKGGGLMRKPMINIVRLKGLGFIAILRYRNKQLSKNAIIGVHECPLRMHLGRVTGEHLKKKGYLLACEQCHEDLSFEEDLTHIPLPGKHGTLALEHICVKCHSVLTISEILDAEHNLCVKCKTKGGKK